MRFYVISATFIVFALLAYISFQQDIFHTQEMPYDDEQVGLNDQIIIHFSHVVAENSPKGIAAAKFAQLVQDKSDGRIIVQIHPNGILYNDATELQALRDGNIQMIAPTISKMTTELPNWQVLDLPFIFENDAQVYAVLQGPLSKQLLDELKKLNIRGFTYWNSGFKQMATKLNPLLEIEDFKDVRVRTMPSAILQEQFEMLHATPIITTFNELYRQLQSGQIIAQENTLSNIYSKNFYGIQNEITLSNHGILAYAVMMNETFWQKLDDNAQHIITDSINEMQQWQHQQSIVINEENLTLLQHKDNVHLHQLVDSQRKQWEQQLQPLYESYADHFNRRYYNMLLQEISNVQNDVK